MSTMTLAKRGKLALVGALFVSLVVTTIPEPVNAGALRGGLIGGLGGALIGGIVGGRGGLVVGAVIGGVGGAIIGDNNARKRQYRRRVRRRR